PIADMGAHQTMVTAALAAKRSAETPKKARSPVAAPTTRSALVVLIVTAQPDARLVAPLGGTVEPLVHAPKRVQPARVRGVRVIDDAVLQHERARARPLARIRGRVGSGHGCERGGSVGCRARGYRDTLLPAAWLQRRLALVVVFDA